MKTILTLLTGIVILITILAAGGCKNGPGKGCDTLAESDSLKIFLTDIVMGDTVKSMHLYMSDTRKPLCPVIDNLQTVVCRGDSVFFMKGKQSRVKTVDTIYQVDFKEEKKVFDVAAIKGKELYVLVIADDAPTDTIVKYVIEFTHKDSGNMIFIIDPYLRIPPP